MRQQAVWKVILSIAAVCCTGGWQLAAAATCADFDATVRIAERAADAEAAKRAFAEAEGSGVCAGAELQHIGRNTALAFYRKAFADGMSSADRDSLLRQGLKFGRPWQVTASVGDIDLAAGRFESAAGLYQETLDDLRDATANPQAPSKELITTLVKKAEEARILAPIYVKRVDRAGAPSGLACPVYRGFEVKKTSLPIEFVFRETTFTPKGRAAADDMLGFLTRQGSPDISLIGHTDPRGSDEHNLKLSKDRAAAVAKFLQGQGYKGRISTSGKGETERFQPDDPTRYDEEQLFQLDRRVELDRKSGGTQCAASNP